MDSSGVVEELCDDPHELSLQDLEPCLTWEYDEFPRYFHRWVKFYRRKPYNTKKGYDRGFVQAKTKKRNPAALHGEWLISCVERHLKDRVTEHYLSRRQVAPASHGAIQHVRMAPSIKVKNNPGRPVCGIGAVLVRRPASAVPGS